MREWVKECLAPLVTEQSVLLLDSWSGQQDGALFSEVSQFCPKCPSTILSLKAIKPIHALSQAAPLLAIETRTCLGFVHRSPFCTHFSDTVKPFLSPANFSEVFCELDVLKWSEPCKSAVNGQNIFSGTFDWSWLRELNH